MGEQSIKQSLYQVGFVILSLGMTFVLLAADSLDKKVDEIVKVIEDKKEALKINAAVERPDVVDNNAEKGVDGFRYILNCSECHGFEGNSVDPQWPNIAGLNKNYITRQLEDFKSGKRVNEEMTRIVREFPSDTELVSLADYFSKQKIQNPNTPNTIKKYKLVDLKLGEEIFTGKRIEYGIPACSACHGEDGMGDKLGKFPQLVGQYMDYTIKQMKLFRSKERKNDTPAQMRNIASQMDDEDIESVAAYIAYIGVK